VGIGTEENPADHGRIRKLYSTDELAFTHSIFAEQKNPKKERQ
jgi:hypothetical protein